MQYDDISQLPERYQAQVRRKLAGQSMTQPEREAVRAARREQQRIVSGSSREAAVRKKYHNQELTVDGIRFDSKKEARRFVTLREMERCGQISGLRLQVNFTLQEGYTTAEGVRVRPIVYRADFTYQRQDGGATTYIVEDVKSRGTKTRIYEIKRKLLREKFGLEITEV